MQTEVAATPTAAVAEPGAEPMRARGDYAALSYKSSPWWEEKDGEGEDEEGYVAGTWSRSSGWRG